MWGADLEQIEIRLGAHRSQDETMLEYVRNDYDLHAKTTVELFDDIREAVMAKFGAITPEALHWVKAEFPKERGKCKNFNFSIQYGAGPKRAAQTLGCSEEKGADAIERFHRAYPGFSRYMEAQHTTARNRGFIRTMLMRYCHLPHANSSSFRARKQAERQAVNYGIQGSAADVIMLAMILIDRDPKLKKFDVEMLLQVHDELLFEGPGGLGEAGNKEVSEQIRKLMSDPFTPFGLKYPTVPIGADVKSGDNWGEIH